MKWLSLPLAFLFVCIFCSGDYKSYGGREDIVERFYSDLADRNSSLKQIEKDIESNNKELAELTAKFNQYHIQSTEFYSVALGKTRSIKDTALATRVQKLVNASDARYQSSLANLVDLLNRQLKEKSISIQDYHLAIKIITTLPLIEKYQQENRPSDNEYEELLKQMNVTLGRMKAIAE